MAVGTVKSTPSERELEVMSVLWDRGSGTVAEVREEMNELYEPDLAYTTVLTILRSLRAKGWARVEVRLDLFDEDQGAGMLTWPHSGFHVHTAVWIPEDDRAFATRLSGTYPELVLASATY